MRRILFGLLATILVASLMLSCAPQPAPVPTPTPTPAPTPAPTPTPEKPYYEGKRIEIVVSSEAGGGTDMVGRIAASLLGKYIPGNPEIIISNQPGAGGAVACKVFYETVRPDGLTLIQSASTSIAAQQEKGAAAIGFDLTKFKYVGNIIRSPNVLMIKKGERARLTDPSAKPIQVGCKEGNETWMAVILWAKEFLGWNVKVVPGYAGTSEMEMAFYRPGEVDMFGTSNAAIIRRMSEEGLAELLVCESNRPDFPDVPSFEAILGDKKPTGLPWQAFRVWYGVKLIDKWLAAPPGTPDDIVAILVEAYIKMSQGPEFDEMMKQRVSEAYTVYTGQKTADVMNSILTAPPEVLDYIEELKIKAGIIAE